MTAFVITFWLALQIPVGLILGRLLSRNQTPRPVFVPVLTRSARRRRD